MGVLSKDYAAKEQEKGLMMDLIRLKDEAASLSFSFAE